MNTVAWMSCFAHICMANASVVQTYIPESLWEKKQWSFGVIQQDTVVSSITSYTTTPVIVSIVPVKSERRNPRVKRFFIACFCPTRGVPLPKRVVLETSRWELSREVSVGVRTLLVVEKYAIKNANTWVRYLRLLRYYRDVCIHKAFLVWYKILCLKCANLWRTILVHRPPHLLSFVPTKLVWIRVPSLARVEKYSVTEE